VEVEEDWMAKVRSGSPIAGYEESMMSDEVRSPMTPGGAGLTRQKFLRDSVGLALSMSGIAALAGCGSSDPATTSAGKPPARPTGRMVAVIPGEPLSLDPAMSIGQADLPIMQNVYDGLLTYDKRYAKLAPALAESWEVNDEATEWTFHLRQGVKFHDGEPVDSTAVRKTFEYYETQPAGLPATLLPKFRKIDDSDPAVLRLVAETTSPDFLRNQTFLRIISPKLVAKGAEAVGKTPIGSGPFRFVRFDRGRTVVLEAAPEHWGDGPYFDHLEFRIIADPSTSFNALMSGQVDLVEKLLPTQARQLGNGTGTAKPLATDTWTVNYMVMRTDVKPTSDVRVRQAIAYAIDKEALLKSVLFGQGQVAHSVVPPGVYGYHEPETKYEHDPERARHLLAQAGYRDGLRVGIGGNAVTPATRDMTEAIAGQLAEIGVQADVEVLDQASLGKDFANTESPRFQIFFFDHGFLTGGPLQLTTNTFGIFSRYAGKDLVELTNRMNATPDGPKRLDIMAEAQELIAQKVLYLPITTPRLTDGVRKDLEGYVPPKDGFMPVIGRAYVPA
jgi:peptide/nickel transport system substrate-binding protein